MLKTSCRLCMGADLALAADLPPLPLVDAYSSAPNTQPLYPCGLAMCRACGHIQLSHVIDPALLYGQGYLFRTADYPWLVTHFEQYAERAYAEFAPEFVVEIGSNDGTLLEAFERRGAQVLGVDPSRVPARTTTMEAYFSGATAATVRHAFGAPDLILANHVFAHIDDLEGIVKAVRFLLAPGGVFIFEAAYGLDLLEQHYFDTVYHEHLDYHTVAPLARFFRRLGMELFRVEHNDAKGGSIRGYAGIGRAQELSVREAMDEEDACGALRPAVFDDWNARLAARRERVLIALAGEKAIGYGAAAGGIASMYHLGLADRIRWIVDDSPRRQGMYAPHSNLVVKSPDTLYSVRERDLAMPEGKCVVLAWRYAEAIKAKHPALEFIVP